MVDSAHDLSVAQARELALEIDAVRLALDPELSGFSTLPPDHLSVLCQLGHLDFERDSPRTKIVCCINALGSFIGRISVGRLHFE